MANAGATNDSEENKTEQKDKGKEVDAGISDDKAFLVGIDWFTEIFFFYGLLFGICWWEFKKFAASQRGIN